MHMNFTLSALTSNTLFPWVMVHMHAVLQFSLYCQNELKMKKICNKYYVYRPSGCTGCTISTSNANSAGANLNCNFIRVLAHCAVVVLFL